VSVSAPTVSVVMPVLNGERFVGAAIASILAQTVRDLELIVVDNGSTDATPDLVRAAARDPRLRSLSLPRPDLVAALNLGLAEARAPVVARMDADDVARPRRLERQLAVLARHPEVAVVSCAYRRIDEDGVVLGTVRPPTRREGLAHLMRHYCLYLSSGATMRRDAVLGVGGFHTSYPPAEDYDLWLRLLDAGHELENLREPLVDYRVVGTGLTLSRGALQRRRAARAVVASRLRGAGVAVDPAAVEAVEDTDLPGLLPPGRLVGLRLVLDGLDEAAISAADDAALDAIARRVLPLVPPEEPDGDLALVAYRIATRARELGRPLLALAWYSRALRSHRALTVAMARRSVGSLLGRR